MHLLGAPDRRSEHTGGGEPASGSACQAPVLPHLAYGLCTRAAPRRLGRRGPPRLSRGPAAAHPVVRRDMPGDTRHFSSRRFGGEGRAAQPAGEGRAVTKARPACSLLPSPPPKEGGELARPRGLKAPQAARALPTCRPRGGHAPARRFVPHPGRARLGTLPAR